MPLLRLLIQLYIYVLVATAILSWFPDNGPGTLRNIRYALRSITEPVLVPLRRAIPVLRVGGTGIDLSVFILVFVLQIVQRVV